MYFEQFYLACLAHASYMIGSEGEAAVVDPQRDVDIYLKAAEEQNLKIRHIFETHLHADFVSGHKELAARTGATIYIGAEAKAGFPHVALHEGDEVKVGAVRIRALETPGHTPEGMCFVVTEITSGEKSPDKKTPAAKPPQPYAVLTGDTLFIGDVGRPDLSPTHTPQQLAGQLYDSLHKKLLALPDATLVYPAHGAGSLCGRAMRAEKSSTIGTERLTNYALQIPSRDEFVRQLTTNLPTRPNYFAEDAEINRSGAATLTELTAVSVADAIAKTRFGGARVIAAGGGAHNRTLLARIAARLEAGCVETSDSMGMPVDAKEAVAFAVLGYETLRERAANAPAATGARHAVTLGAIAPHRLHELLAAIARECSGAG